MRTTPRSRWRAACLPLLLAALPSSPVFPSPDAPPSPAAPDAAPGEVGLANGILERREARGRVTWYEPILDYLVPYDFAAYPVIRKDDKHGTSLLLRAVRKGERALDVEGLEVVLEGGSTSIPIEGRDRDVDHDGCRVVETVTLEDREALIRRVVPLHHVDFVLHGIGGVYRFALSEEDLERFRRVVAYYDRLASRSPAPTPISVPAPGSKPDAGKGVTNPEPISRVEPVYPAQARDMKKKGRVTLQAMILKNGEVGDLRVLLSTACDCGFEAAAIEAVKQWRYKPATLDGQPVDVYFTVEVDFTRR